MIMRYKVSKNLYFYFTKLFYLSISFIGEANKTISDYKYKLQKSEQEIASLQASLARSETQVIRYKSTAEAAEKAEAELKVERRKLQREVRCYKFIRLFFELYYI